MYVRVPYCIYLADDILFHLGRLNAFFLPIVSILGECKKRRKGEAVRLELLVKRGDVVKQRGEVQDPGATYPATT